MKILSLNMASWFSGSHGHGSRLASAFIAADADGPPRIAYLSVSCDPDPDATGGPIVRRGTFLVSASSSSFEWVFGHFAPSPFVLHSSNWATDTLFLRMYSTSAALNVRAGAEDADEMDDDEELCRCWCCWLAMAGGDGLDERGESLIRLAMNVDVGDMGLVVSTAGVKDEGSMPLRKKSSNWEPSNWACPPKSWFDEGDSAGFAKKSICASSELGSRNDVYDGFDARSW